MPVRNIDVIETYHSRPQLQNDFLLIIGAFLLLLLLFMNMTFPRMKLPQSSKLRPQWY